MRFCLARPFLKKEGKIAHALEAAEDGLLTYPTAKELLSAASRQTLDRLKKDLDAIAQRMAGKDWDNALILRPRRWSGILKRRRSAGWRSRRGRSSGKLPRIRSPRKPGGSSMRTTWNVLWKPLRAGCVRSGPVPILIALEAEAKRAVERRENLASARQLCDKRNWTRAEVVLRRMIERDASDREAQALLEGVSKERENEQNWKFREGREEARRALRELRFEDAEIRSKIY